MNELNFNLLRLEKNLAPRELIGAVAAYVIAAEDLIEEPSVERRKAYLHARVDLLRITQTIRNDLENNKR